MIDGSGLLSNQCHAPTMVTVKIQFCEKEKHGHPYLKTRNVGVLTFIFQDWTRELMTYGSKGVLRGLEGVRDSGSAYIPPLNKFLSLCKNESESTDCRPGESFSEQEHGGRLKPTPNGVPLSWTIGNYSYEELMASGHPEDAEKAISLK